MNNRALEFLINSYYNNKMLEWFLDDRKVRPEVIECFKAHQECSEDEDHIDEVYTDKFISDLFNNWTVYRYNFYRYTGGKHFFDKHIKASELVELLTEMSYIQQSEFGEVSNPVEKGIGETWNTLAYWYVYANKSKYIDSFSECFKQLYSDWRDKDRHCRLSCGICYENKVLYTGCSTCNGNYVCKSCYTSMDDNCCPFCRCDEMIQQVDDREDDDNLNEWSEKMVVIHRDVLFEVYKKRL